MLKRILKGIVGIFTILVLIFSISLLIIDRGKFIDVILTLVGGKIYAKNIISQLITPRTFNIVRILFFSSFLIFTFIYIKWNYLYDKIKSVLGDIYRSGTLRIKNNFGEFKWLVPIPLFFSIYYATTLPIFIDEAYTYLNFSTRSLLTAMTYYPATNNHILNSIVTSIFVLIPYFPQTILLRTPSILINVLTLFFVFSFTKEYLGKKVAMLSTAIYSTLFFIVYYSFLARGYEIFMLFFVLATYSAFKIISGRNNSWVYFSIYCILSLYNAPWFLYPFLMLNIFILILSPHQIKNSIKYNTYIGFITLLLYIPLIIVNGLKALINNEYNKPISRHEVISRLPSFLLNSYETISGYNIWLIFIVMFFSFIVIFLKHKKLFVYGLVLIILLPIFLITHSVIPFARTIIFYAFIMAIFPAAAVENIISKSNKLIIITLCLVIQLIQIFKFNKRIYSFEKETINTEIIVKEAVKYKKVCVCSFLFCVYFDYYYKSHKLPFPAMTILNEKKLDCDTMINKYDLIVVDSAYDRTRVTPKFIDATPYHVYKKN